MNRSVRFVLSVVVMLTLILGSMAMIPAARSEASVHLKGGVFVPSQSNFAAGSQKYFMRTLKAKSGM